MATLVYHYDFIRCLREEQETTEDHAGERSHQPPNYGSSIPVAVVASGGEWCPRDGRIHTLGGIL